MSDDIDDKLTKLAMRSRAGTADAADVRAGVTVTFLMEVFGMDRMDVKRRLKDCPVMGARNKDSGRNLYDLATAAQYLVKPVFDPEEYLRTMKVSELPATLQDSFWSAMNKRQKWEREAGNLWHTEDVMEVFGRVFKLIKGALQLWAEDMERSVGLSSEQKVFLRAKVDGLQKELHAELVEINRETKPQTEDLAKMMADERQTEVPAEDFDDLI